MAKDPGIIVSPAHGMNPMLVKCFVCLEDKDELLLMGRISRFKAKKMFGDEIADKLHGADDDLEAPRGVTLNREPCSKCRGYMDQGIILISCDAEKSPDKNNPYRSGGWVVMKESAMRRIMGEQNPTLETVLKHRMAFIDDETWDALGLPRAKEEAEGG